MWVYVVKRLVIAGFTLFGIALISFLVVVFAPGDPASMKASGLAQGQSAISEQTLEKNRELFFLDRPVLFDPAPPTRATVVREELEDLLTADEKLAREDAAAKLAGTIGTAALDVLIEALPEVAAAARQEAAARAGRLDALAAAGEAALPDLLEGLEEAYPDLVPRLPPREDRPYTPAERAKAWLDQRALLVEEAEAPARRLLAVLATIAGPAGPELAEGAALADAEAAWSAWWEAHAPDYRAAAGDAAAAAWLAEGEVPEAEGEEGEVLARLTRVGQRAIPALYEAMRAAEEGSPAESKAAWGLAHVAHKPWDLTTTPAEREAYASEWEQARQRLEDEREVMHASAYARQEAELGDQESYVARLEAEEFARQRYRWKDWWYRAEEYYVDFSATRQAGRAFTQTQFGRWMTRLANLDFGESYQQKRPVAEILLDRLPVTLTLNLASFTLAYLLAIPLGIFSATHRNSTADKVTTIGLFLLYSVPSFWAASMLILFFTGPPFLDWFPNYHFRSLDADKLSLWGQLKDVAKHLVLPVVCLTYGQLAYISRQMRSSMLEAIRQDYVRTARAKGLPASRVVYKHALRNALIPIVTLLGSLLPFLFAGSVIIESIFSLDGLGKLFFDGLLARDYPVLMAILVISAFLTLLGILLADLAYAVVDPRIEYR